MADKANPIKQFDIRTLDQLLARGELTQKDYDKYLTSLSDDAGNYEEVVMVDEADDADLDVIDDDDALNF